MTRKRMLAMINSKSLSKFIEAADLPKSVFPRSSKSRRNHGIVDQHSKTATQEHQIHVLKEAFQAQEFEKNSPQQMLTYISSMLHLEGKHFVDSSFLFHVDPVIEDKVNSDLRDVAVKNVQIMNKVFFELPVDVFVRATGLVDRFITKVKVKPKYMSCVATACFYIAAKTAEPVRVNCPPLETLSQLSKCGGTVQDLERMVDIIAVKLSHNFDFVTSHNFLDFFHKVRSTERLCSWWRLEALLEVAQTSLEVCYQKPSVVALACLLVNPVENDLTFVKAMANACKVELKPVMKTADSISQLFRAGYSRQPCSRDSLIWAISKRTLSNIYGASPTSLATIFEEVQGCSIDNNRNDVFVNEDWSSSFESLFEFHKG